MLQFSPWIVSLSPSGRVGQQVLGSTQQHPGYSTKNGTTSESKLRKPQANDPEWACECCTRYPAALRHGGVGEPSTLPPLRASCLRGASRSGTAHQLSIKDTRSLGRAHVSQGRWATARPCGRGRKAALICRGKGRRHLGVPGSQATHTLRPH